MSKTTLFLCLLFFIPARADGPESTLESNSVVFSNAFKALLNTIKKRDELRLRLSALDVKGKRLDSDEKWVKKLDEMLAQKVPFSDGDLVKKLHKLSLKLEVEEEKGKICDSHYWYFDKSSVSTTLLCIVGILISAGIIQKSCENLDLNGTNIKKVLGALAGLGNRMGNLQSMSQI
jgi:hypothetical protein